MANPIISAREFDYLFDNGMDTTPFDDCSQTVNDSRFASQECVTWHIPRWLQVSLSTEAETRGMALEALVSTWLGDRLKEERNREAQTMVSIALRDSERMNRWIDNRVSEVREKEETAFAHAQKTLTPQDVAPLLPLQETGQKRA